MHLPLLLTDRPSCADYKNNIRHNYHPVRHCQKSNKTAIGLANFNTVDKCAEFASKRKAMAFNYAYIDRGTVNLFNKLKGLQIQN